MFRTFRFAAILALGLGLASTANAEMTNIGLDLPLVSTGHVLTAGASTAGGAILYAPSEADDIQLRDEIAAATGAVCDYFDPRIATPTVADLGNYDLVFTWANYAYFDNVGFGDNLADYVDAGGRVLLCQWCLPTAGNFLSGRIMDPAQPYLPCTAVSATYTLANYNVDGSYCLFTSGIGVVDGSLSSNYRDNITDNGVGIMDTGTWSDGQNICAYLSDNSVAYYAGVPSYLFSGGTVSGPIANFAKCAPPIPGPDNLDCQSVGCDPGPGDVELNWSNPGGLDEVIVRRNGTVIATLAASATSYTDAGAPSGSYSYSVRGTVGGSPTSGDNCSVLHCPGTTDDYLLFDWDTGDAPPHFAEQAVAGDGRGYVAVYDEVAFQAEMSGAFFYKVVIVENPYWQLTQPSVDAIINYINNDGLVLLNYWDLDVHADLQAAVGVASEVDYTFPVPVYAVSGMESHPIWDGPNGTFTDIQVISDVYIDDGGYATVAGNGIEVGTNDPGGAAGIGQGALTVLDTNRVVTNHWTHRSMDPAIQLPFILNELDFLQGGGPAGPTFHRGDSNADDTFDISDAVFTLSALFVFGSPAPGCLDAADANDDGTYDISDAVFTLSALFVLGSPSPPAPGPQPASCGEDPTADGLDCATYAPCP